MRLLSKYLLCLMPFYLTPATLVVIPIVITVNAKNITDINAVNAYISCEILKTSIDVCITRTIPVKINDIAVQNIGLPFNLVAAIVDKVNITTAIIKFRTINNVSSNSDAINLLFGLRVYIFYVFFVLIFITIK